MYSRQKSKRKICAEVVVTHDVPGTCTARGVRALVPVGTKVDQGAELDVDAGTVALGWVEGGALVDGGADDGLQALNAPDILTKAINKALMADDCALTLVRTL